eukprot:554080-Pleurochrysis_carterae.AAC.1
MRRAPEGQRRIGCVEATPAAQVARIAASSAKLLAPSDKRAATNRRTSSTQRAHFACRTKRARELAAGTVVNWRQAQSSIGGRH